MSTTDPTEAAAAAGAPLDLLALTRLANAMFSALPGSTVGIDTVPAAPPAAAEVTAGVPAAMTPVGSGSPERALAQAGAGAPVPDPRPAGSSLYFLDLAPPSLPWPLGSGSPERAPALAPVAPPQLPAAADPRASGSSFYFLDLARPRPTVPGIPGTDAFGGVPAALPAAHPPFDVEAIRRDFPILAERINGRPLIWLDNGATTQKPQAVIDRLRSFYEHENSNIHRAAHELAARATDAYEGARDNVRRFLNAASPEEIVFVRGATEAINLVAKSWGRKHLDQGDEIVLSHLEHHANIVPWQQVAEETGARLRVIPVDDRGQVLLEAYGRLLGPRTKLVAFTHVSNAIGTVTPAREMVAMARRYGAHVLLDGAQSVPHLRIDVQDLDCDWFVFSGHKVFAPTGIGVVYGKGPVLAAMPPWQGGGNMIRDVTFERTEYQPPPGLFEAGTGNIADAVGLGTALDYVERVGLGNIARHEHELLEHATRLLQAIPGLHLFGSAPDKAAVLSFVLDGFRSEDVGKALNHEGIAVRAGHHCAQPILRRFGVETTVRASLALYNTMAEVETLADVLRQLRSASPMIT